MVEAKSNWKACIQDWPAILLGAYRESFPHQFGNHLYNTVYSFLMCASDVFINVLLCLSLLMHRGCKWVHDFFYIKKCCWPVLVFFCYKRQFTSYNTQCLANVPWLRSATDLGCSFQLIFSVPPCSSVINPLCWTMLAEYTCHLKLNRLAY